MQELLDKLEALRKALESLKGVISAIEARDTEGYDLWQVMLDELEALAQAPYSYGLPQARSQAVYLYGTFTREYRAVYGTPLPEHLRKAFVHMLVAMGVKRKRLGSLAEGEKFGNLIVLKREPSLGCAWVIQDGRKDLIDLNHMILG